MSCKGDIAIHVIDHFSLQFQEPMGIRPQMAGLLFKQITDQQRRDLKLPFFDIEVENALAKCVGGKAPGPDGFPVGVLKETCKFMKPEFMEMFSNFHSFAFDWRLNITMLALIPTVKDASWIKEFRPISLINSAYKFIAKVLANRLKDTLEYVISET